MKLALLIGSPSQLFSGVDLPSIVGSEVVSGFLLLLTAFVFITESGV
jgi:hypothetical protein